MTPPTLPVVLAETCTPSGEFLITGETAPLVLFFLIGLLGGAHCLGMCGPLVATYADRMTAGDRRSDLLTLRDVRQHALFNLGRTTSYAVIGGLFGLAGQTLFFAPRSVSEFADDVHAVSGTVIGLFVIAIGVSYLLGSGGLSASLPGLGRLATGVNARVLPRIDRWVNDSRIAGLGALHGILPCPLTYPAYLYAFVQASPSGGALTLGLLGVGTIPAMFATGTAIGSLGVERRHQLHRVLGIVIVALGYIPLQHGLAVYGVPLPHPPIPYYQPL